MARPLDEIMSEASEEPELPLEGGESTEQQAERERNRDPGGRFAQGFREPAAAPSPTDAAQAPEPKAPDGYVPIQAMDARLAKQEERFNSLLQQNQQLMQALNGFAPKPAPKPQEPAPDFFDDPDKAFDHRIQTALNPVREQHQQMVEHFSSTIAIKDFGVEPVKAAYEALSQQVQQHGPQYPAYQKIMASRHPYGDMVKWHQETSALSRYGADPDAYIKAEIEKGVQAALGQNGNAGRRHSGNGAVPGNFSGGRNAGTRTTQGSSGPRPLSEIMGR